MRVPSVADVCTKSAFGGDENHNVDAVCVDILALLVLHGYISRNMILATMVIIRGTSFASNFRGLSLLDTVGNKYEEVRPSQGTMRSYEHPLILHQF